MDRKQFLALAEPFSGESAGPELKRYYRSLIGPLAFGLSLGLQVTVTAFMLLGPASDPQAADQLTVYAKSLVRPERDLPILVAGVILSLVASLSSVWWWRTKLARVEASQAVEFMTSTALLMGVLALTSAGAYLLLLSSYWFSHDPMWAPSGIRESVGGLEGLTMLVPAYVALLCAVLDLECGSFSVLRSNDWYERWRWRINRVLLYGIPIFIILIVGVPWRAWSDLAGQFLQIEECHHQNFFIMGPAISFAHGRAFGSEIYSQYGIGWPLLASGLSHWSALTYSSVVGLEIVYACVYYIALYFLLRSCLRQEVWAAFGVILALSWQIFSGMDRNNLIWMHPSSTMMRHPVDVWFFLALLKHQRSRGTLWVALAGVIAAFGTFLETETGIYLLVTFLVYYVLRAGLAPGESRPTGNRLLSPLVFYGTTAVSLLLLLLYASRGTLFTHAFWQGWLEPLVTYGSWGLGALPIAELPDAPLIFFVIMVTVYTAAIAYAAIRGMHRSARNSEVLLATAAAYGLALLLLFVNRSHPYNLSHPAVPFAVVLTIVMFQGYKRFTRFVHHSSLPYVLAGSTTMLLLAKAEFLRYPSLLASFLGRSRPIGLYLMPNPMDVSGLPPSLGSYVVEFNAITSAIRSTVPDGKDVAILDTNDTILCLATNVTPWSRYSPLFPMALTSQSVSRLRNDLIARPPKWVVIRGENSTRQTYWDFVWGPLYEVVRDRYRLHKAVSGYEIWRRST